MKELLVYIESIIPDEEVKKSWFTLPIIMQSKNTRDFSHEMNWIDRCQINNLKINDKYSALNIYICYNIDEVKTYGSCQRQRLCLFNTVSYRMVCKVSS